MRFHIAEALRWLANKIDRPKSWLDDIPEPNAGGYYVPYVDQDLQRWHEEFERKIR